MNKIKQLRKSTGLTQKLFSKKYNVPMRTLQGWELGERIPSDYVVELLEFKVYAQLYLNEKGLLEDFEAKIKTQATEL